MLSEEFALMFEEMKTLTQKLPVRIDIIKKELMLCQHEENDIKHKMEISKFNAYQGWVLSRDMQITLIKRRELKDELAKLEGVLEKLNKRQTCTQHAHQIVQSVKDRDKKNKSRTYSVRVRKDFVDDESFVIR